MKILDTTLRDGSYAVNFKFSCEDVAEFSKKLEILNMDFIEIGHGMGLNASSYERGIAMNSDIEYMDAARQSIDHTPFGFFCIPGIARFEDLKTAKEHGVSFVRIGVNADQWKDAIAYITEAKKLGFTVMTNYMKSYLVSPEDFANNAKAAEDSGADYVYVVDSSGGFTPEKIERYYDRTRAISNIKLGFHGHNNLGLAVSNTVFCAKKGFDIIDCSLQGLGRSLGNASTEMVIMTLAKMGYTFDIDIPRLLEYGYVLMSNLGNKQAYNPLDLICGYTDFHSSNLKYIYKCCNETHVDPLRLILAYSKINKKDVDYKELCEVARSLPVDLDKNPYSFRDYFGTNYMI